MAVDRDLNKMLNVYIQLFSRGYVFMSPRT